MGELYMHVRCNNSGPPFSTFSVWGGAPTEHHSSICSFFLLIDPIFRFLSRNVVVKQQKHAAALQDGSGIHFCVHRSSFFSLWTRLKFPFLSCWESLLCLFVISLFHRWVYVFFSVFLITFLVFLPSFSSQTFLFSQHLQVTIHPGRPPSR